MKVFVHLTFHNIPKFEPTFFQIWKTFLGLFKGVLGGFFVKMCVILNSFIVGKRK